MSKPDILGNLEVTFSIYPLAFFFFFFFFFFFCFFFFFFFFPSTSVSCALTVSHDIIDFVPRCFINRIRGISCLSIPIPVEARGLKRNDWISKNDPWVEVIVG